jgi:hypothetical protein
VTLSGARATSSGELRRDDLPAVRAAARAHVDEVVGGGEQIQVMVDDDDRGPGLQQPVEHIHQCGHVERMQSGGRLVEVRQLKPNREAPEPGEGSVTGDPSRALVARIEARPTAISPHPPRCWVWISAFP